MARGKLPLIKMLATLLFPTKGQILWDGEDILPWVQNTGECWDICRSNSAIIPVIPRGSFCAMPRLSSVYRKKTADGRIERLFELVGLSDAADKKLKKLSGGMLQRSASP